jgi:hypothetical protein
MGKLWVRTGALSTTAAMRLSQSALTSSSQDPELSVIQLADAATVLGAFQRRHGLPEEASAPVFWRGSGGPFVVVGPGTLHVLLALPHVAALVACDPPRLLNRYVRPLLRALTKGGALAHYFGREWLSVGHRPVGQVGFAHDTKTRRAVFEAFVAVTTPFAPAGRGSFMGKEPATLSSVTGRTFDLAELSELISMSYAKASDSAIERAPFAPAEPSRVLPDDPPWAATVTEAIGELGAGVDAAGVFRVGGDLPASHDALERVAARANALGEPTEASIGHIVDEELIPPGVALEGVKDLRSIRDVVLAARTR